MRILVTGCAGFIGAATTIQLLAQGHTVVGIDDMNPDYSKRLKEERINLIPQKNFQYYEGSILLPYFLNNVIRAEGKFDCVYHFASKAGVRHSLSFPRDYINVNTMGTLNILEACVTYEISKLIFSSTSSVYPDSLTQFKEWEPLTTVRSPYAASKLGAEHLISSYCANFGLKATILRYFTVYGLWGRPDMAVLRFIKAIDTGEKIEIYGNGHQERDFTFIDDIVKANVTALTISNSRYSFRVINLGNNQPRKVLDLISAISESMKKDRILIFSPERKEEMTKTWACIDRAGMDLQWKPTTSLEAGIQQTVEWYLAKGRNLF